MSPLRRAKGGRPALLLIDGDVERGKRTVRDLSERVEVHAVSDPEQVAPTLENGWYDVVLLDLAQAGEGLELLKRIRRTHPQLPVVMLAPPGSVDEALQAGRLGANDCLTRDCSPDALLQRLTAILEERLSERRGTSGLGEIAPSWRFIGESEGVRNLLKDALTVAQVDSPVLITGENGTGKEILARFIHHHSPRCEQPFVAVNCAAIPEGLFESELFGHEKGAFTGAVAVHRGSFEQASAGTLLLDEITEIPLALQAKLLRTVQSGEYSRIGSERIQWATARVICSTNREPRKAVAEGQLRQDLFYRINVVHLHIPPLRERREDIAVQANHFLREKGRELGKRVNRLSRQAEALLLAHDWPGNSRELENLIERAVVFCEGEEIGPELMGPISEGAALLALAWEEAKDLAMRQFERSYLTALLQVYAGSVSRAAKAMGVSRQAFYKALERAGVNAESFRRGGKKELRKES